MGYPDNERELHEKALAVEGRKLEISAEEREMSREDLCVKWFSDDLRRMSFLFSQYDDKRCVEKNQFKMELKMVDAPTSEEERRKGLTRMEFAGTPEQHAEADRHMKRAREIDSYRLDCLHKAIKMLDIYIENLWY